MDKTITQQALDFLKWTELENDSILVKRIYIDIAGSLPAGVILSQIIYWNLPSIKGDETRLRIKKNGRLWLVKKNSDWWDECRIKATTARRSLESLEKKGIISLELHKFQGFPTMHIALNIDVLQNLIENEVRFRQIGKNRIDQNGKKDFAKLANSLTETTNKDYSQTTFINGAQQASHYSPDNNKINLSNVQKLIKQLTICEQNKYTLEFYGKCKNIIEYYLNEYQTHKGDTHPIIKKEYWPDIFDRLRAGFTDDENYFDIIDQYFRDPNLDCDHNIIHFSQFEIMLNRAFDVDRKYASEFCM